MGDLHINLKVTYRRVPERSSGSAGGEPPVDPPDPPVEPPVDPPVDPPDPPVDPPDPDPVGYFFSPTGLSTNTGSYSSPWDIKSALDGTQTIPIGETLWALPGTYPPRAATGPDSIASTTYPGQTENKYEINLTGVTIRAYGATAVAPYPAIFQFGLSVVDGADDNTLHGLWTESTTAFPLTEPTIAGSPYPGNPAAAPAGWAYWASSGGIGIGVNSGTTLRDCVVQGAAGGVSAFQATDLTLEGVTATNRGWVATDRDHGHPLYLGNPSNAVADRNTLVRCIASTSEVRVASTTERVALHYYRESVNEQNWDILKTWAKGTAKFQSLNFVLQNMICEALIVEAARVGTAPGTNGGDNCSWGRPSQLDDDVTLTNITTVNARKVADNDIITNLTQTNIRSIKTRSAWYPTQMDQPPAFGLTEVGTFVNAPTTDESYVWPMAFDASIAHAYILDLDDDGSVSVDLTGFATTADSYAAYHYRDPKTIVQSGSLAGGLTITLNITETNSETALLDSTDAWIIRLQ